MQSKAASKFLSYSITITLFILIFILTNKYFIDPKYESEPQKVKEVFISDLSNFEKELKVSSYVTLPPVNSLNEGYGLRIYDSVGNFINKRHIETLDKDSLELFISAINATQNNDYIGILVSLDGEFQKFKVDNKDIQYIYQTELKKLSRKNIPIYLQNDLIAENTRLDIVMIYYLKELPGTKMKYIDFYTNSITFNLNPNKNKKVDRLSEILLNSEYILKTPEQFKNKNRTKGVRNVIDAGDISQSNLSQNNIITIKKNLENNLHLYSAGGKGKYATTLFIDNSPIKVGESITNYYELGENELMAKMFKINDAAMVGSYPAFSLTVPLENDLPFVFSSQKFVLEVQ